MVDTRSDRVTIRAVATAGVSTGTVSRVFNHYPDVSARARERVRAASARLNYRPSPIGRGLSTRSMAVVGILAPDMTDPVFMVGASAMAAIASQHGYAVMLTNTDRQPHKMR